MSTHYVSIEKWRGPRDDVELDPATIEFLAVARNGQSCKGCHFERQWSAVCDKVSAEAARRGLPDCLAGHVYKVVEKDPRQIDALENSAWQQSN